VGVLFCIDRSIDRLNGGGLSAAFAVSQKNSYSFLVHFDRSIERQKSTPKKKIDEKKKKKLTTCKAHGTSSSHLYSSSSRPSQILRGANPSFGCAAASSASRDCVRFRTWRRRFRPVSSRDNLDACIGSNFSGTTPI